MKSINLTFDDRSFERLKNEKKKTNLKWEDYILELIKK
jgi:hypothetical protein